MIIIDSNIVGALLGFLIGFAVAYINFLVSKLIITKYSDKFAVLRVVRQVLNISCLVALYALGKCTPWDGIYLLVGGALGNTLPMIPFTHLLIKQTKEEKKDG